ncbi:related to transporter (major facilitator superfamily) [Lecanosticta acicola]|uniref:Related to transporter (Major facilitator superfamily) n=1 Tax=Lecanosticta acicola TaxID=111012 RepID=A0AAI9EC28_9PEZI|nr:related to transporter (major facilitator superfamily) [Lecanosticta acicola]
MRPEEASNGKPTEASPLLPKSSFPSPRADGGPSNGTFDHPESAEADGGTLERQTTTTSLNRLKQYEGLPEVKKQLPIIFPAVATGVFLSAADQTIIVSSYGKIGSELNALSLTPWIATAYFLTLTSFQPLYGKLSDIFGRKACLLFGYTIFGLGCLGCGLARDIKELIAARAFAGIGGGAMTTVVSILLSDICTLRERGQFQGYVNIIFAAGASAGAPLGGLAADYIGWRWAFLIQTPMCAVAFIAVSFALHLPSRDSTDWTKKLRRIDFPGAIVLISAVFTLLLALDRGSNVSWTVPVTYIPLAISIPLFVVFVLVEMKVAVEPFAPGHIIFNGSMVACYLCNFFSMGGWLAAVFYAPLFFQAVDHLSATGAGLRLIPSVITGVLGSLFAGFYMRRTGKYYILTIVAYSLLTCGLIVVFLCSGVATRSSIGIIIGMCICGLGNGNGITTTLIGVIANASHEDQAVATACTYLFRSLGSVFGVSLSATFANQSLRKKLASELPRLGLPEKEALDIASKVRQSLEYLELLDPKVRAVVEDCFASSTTAAFGLQIALVSGAAISAWFIAEKALSK